VIELLVLIMMMYKPWNVLGVSAFVMAALVVTGLFSGPWTRTTATCCSAVQAYAADMEIEEPPPADAEPSQPEIAQPPPADFEPSAPEIEDAPPADIEPSQPEIAQPPPADFEPSAPEIKEPEE
jgi:hypothetical protein